MVYVDLWPRPAGCIEYSEALGRPVVYVCVPLVQWRDQELRPRGLPEQVYDHLLTMAKRHAANRYDRLTHDVEAILSSTPAHSQARLARRARRPREVIARVSRIGLK